jgi:putative intracellular protease/amidase
MAETILIPLPDRDFDATETTMPWHACKEAGYRVVFATEHGGKAPECDEKTLTGAVFDLFGAPRSVRELYREMTHDEAFVKPISWGSVDVNDYAGLVLPGGHAPGMKQYLGSEALQKLVAEFWQLDRPVAAICHGVLVLARAKDPKTKKSVLAASRTTCLPKFAERGAWMATSWKLGNYYRTYRTYVEDEVRAALDDPERQFERGPFVLDPRRIVAAREGSTFVIEDGRYVSGRWPGDATLLAERFVARLTSAKKGKRVDASERADSR